MGKYALATDVVNICAKTLRSYGVPRSTGDARPGMFVALPELFMTGEVYRQFRQNGVPVSPETRLSYLLEKLNVQVDSPSRERVDLTIWKSDGSKPVSAFEFLWEWSGKEKISKDLSRCKRLASVPLAHNFQSFLVSIGSGPNDDKINSIGSALSIKCKLAAIACTRAPIISHGLDSGTYGTLTVKAYLVK